MKLRSRLSWTTALVSLPLIAGLILWDRRSRTVAAEEELLTLTEMLTADPTWQAACERDPVHWNERYDKRPRTPPPPFEFRPPAGPHQRPARFYAYDSRFQPASLQAPALPPQVRSQVADRRVIPVPVTEDPAPPARAHTSSPPPQFRAPVEQPPSVAVRVLVALPSHMQRCRYVLAEGTTEPWLGGVLPPTRIWLAPLLVIIAAVLLAVGPFLRRMQLLVEAVERSAASGYQRSVLIGGDDEVSILAQAFDRAAARVRSQLSVTQQREQALREFLANTTHDVMIPLTVLQGHLARLQERDKDDDPAPTDDAQAAAILAKASDEVHYLGSLLHNLSMAAKLDVAQPPIQLGAVDLSMLVERVVSRHQPVARQLAVTLNSAGPTASLWVTADLTMLEQAVSNLVYNAVRHNRSGGHAAVILESEADGTFALRIIDDGPGIAPAELSRLVERGFRGNAARSRDRAGQGLGLNIAQRVAELHGYRLTFCPSAFAGLEVQLSGTCLQPSD